MKFSVSNKATAAIRRQVRGSQSALRRNQTDMLHAVGVRLLSLSQVAYVTKSRGGTGTDGIKWAPLAPATIAAKNRRGKRNAKRKATKSGKARPGMGQSAIGINTGLQLNSASPGFASPDGGNILEISNASVTVGYGRSYSKYFDEQRQLLPNRLPQSWRAACMEIVTRWATEMMRGANRGR